MHIMGLIPCCTSPAFENTALLNEMTNSNPLSPILHKAEEKKKKNFKPLYNLWAALYSHPFRMAECDSVSRGMPVSLILRWRC